MKFDFEKYVNKAAKTAVYIDDYYPFASILSEAVELGDLFAKKYLRGDPKEIKREDIISEAGDVLWNLAVICKYKNISSFNACSELIDIYEPKEGYTKYVHIDRLIDACYEMKHLYGVTPHPATLKIRSDFVLLRLGEFLKTEGIHLHEVAEYNLAKLRSRKARGVLKGSGGDR